MAKFNFLLVTFLLIFQPIYPQQHHKYETIKETKFDAVYFVLGTLSDYMGRFQYIDRKKQIDTYYAYEKPLVDYLIRYIKTELNTTVDTLHIGSTIKMFSEELSTKLNSFYGEKDKLLNDKFETEHQICSFLAGVYYRYGEKLDSPIYKIQLANSPKHSNCYDFLKKLGCENIFYQYLRNIPAQFKLYFEPTAVLKDYLESIEKENLTLKEAWFKQIASISTSSSEKDLKEAMKTLKAQETEKIRNAFKRKQ